MNKILPIVLGIVAIAGVGYVAFTKNSSISIEPPPATQNLPANPPPAMPTTCTDTEEGAPVITSLSTYKGTVGTTIEIKGCNFSGFEGDKIVVIENSLGERGIYNVGAYDNCAESKNPNLCESSPKIIHVVLGSRVCKQDNSYSGLPCESWLTLAPGVYTIYTQRFALKSNGVIFTVE